ncbi:hypothetical protein J6590_023213 [Homalodisca vitripennis]|nr:hypothetical protein J6590_023213 [Homalodisca vitripennis]
MGVSSASGVKTGFSYSIPDKLAQGADHLCVSYVSGGMAIQLIFRYPIPDQLGSRSYGHGLHRKVAHCGLYLTLKLKGLVTSVYLVPLEYGYTTDLPVTYPRSAG